jgi:hypothetical protein
MQNTKQTVEKMIEISFLIIYYKAINTQYLLLCNQRKILNFEFIYRKFLQRVSENFIKIEIRLFCVRIKFW